MSDVVDKAKAWDAVAEKNAEIARLRAALENVKVAELSGGVIYIGVIGESGCWSAEVPPAGREIFLEWKALDLAKLAIANGDPVASVVRSLRPSQGPRIGEQGRTA